MKCKQCGIEYESKRSTSRYCSAKCRKLAFQRNGKVSVPDERRHRTRTPSIDDYREHPHDYVQRREPDQLNWGEWMDSHQLEQAGLKANRVSIPGDWDYDGVVHEVDGVWVYKSTGKALQTAAACV